jgi:MerR family transcriptional regulator, heat shock protein HspR
MDWEFNEEIEISIDMPIFTTGVVSRILEIPMWMLKQLDEEGIVSPPRDKGKSRLYSKKEMGKLKKVWYYIRERQVKINGIKVILEIEERMEELEIKKQEPYEGQNEESD